MADIFISYSSEDASRIKPLAEALEKQGWSVFWDRKIPPGKTWREVISEALESARAVIVAWSETSVKSRWVQEEADWGLKRNVLIPFFIENVEPPLGFGAIQAANLTDWMEDSNHAGFQLLIGALSDLLGTDKAKLPKPPTTEPDFEKRRVDAVAPSNASLGQSIDVFVQVRFPDSEYLSIKDWPFKSKPSSIEQSSKLTNVKYSKNSQGKLNPACLRIKIVAPEFKVEGEAEKKIEIVPKEFSDLISFQLTPQSLGEQRIMVKVCDENGFSVGELPIETNVNEKKKPIVREATIVVLDLNVLVLVEAERKAEEGRRRKEIEAKIIAEEWLKKDEAFKARTTSQLEEIAESTRLTTEKIHAHLLRTAEETHRRELAETDAIKDWRERQRLRESADNAHAARLIRIEELAASFAEIEGRGTATSVFSEMTRILTEQGVDEAIAYVGTQRPSIFKTVRGRSAGVRQQNRAEMQPLLKAAGLHESKGQAAEAHALYTDILAEEPDWPEALHATFWFHVNQGDIARVRTTLADARRDYEEAHRMAQRLTAGDPSNTQWQFDLGISHELLGEVFLAQGDLPRASDAYLERHRLLAKLAAGDPSNTAWQRDLTVSYIKLGDVAVAQGQLEEAARSYGEGLVIAKKLAAGDPSNTAWQRYLTVSYEKLGEVAAAQGKLREAATSPSFS